MRQMYTTLVGVYRRMFGYPVVYDAFHGSDAHAKRALLVYLSIPFTASAGRRRNYVRHQNWWQNLEIARLVAAAGYVVDVIDYHNMTFLPRRKYDLLMGIGAACARLARLVPEEAVKVYIATGPSHEFNNRQEKMRLADVMRRRNCRLKPRRIVEPIEQDLKWFDAIVSMGNEFNVSTFRPYHNRIYAYNNHGDPRIRCCEKDFETARRSFLYFASDGQVHKGLDLLLEAFPLMPDYHLYVCSGFRQERDFAACYRRELFGKANIHPVGWVNILSRAFDDVCCKCAFVILPSCAEASAGSVVTCMHAGLIPVVSRESGIDTGDFGVTLDSCDPDTIAGTVHTVASYAPDWHRQHSLATRRTALARYSQQAFTKRWENILRDILGGAKGEAP